MNVLGFDPGGTLGTALYESSTGAILLRDFSDPWDAIREFATGRPLDAVVIEDYVGAGVRDGDSIHALKQVGGLAMVFEYLGYEVVVQTPQFRRHMLDVAKALADKLPGGHPPHHSIDALAHVLAYVHTTKGVPYIG